MSAVLRSFWTWLGALMVVIAFSLAVAPSTSLSQQRITHLESLVRCPACANISVAESQAESAIAVRHQIVAAVHNGASDTTILRELESQYGVGILLIPDAGGLGYLLWVIPLGVVLAGISIYLRLSKKSS